MQAQKADQRRHHHRILRHGGYDWAEQQEMPIHAHLSQSNYYLIVLLGYKLMALPFMSIIELVDPELRDALAQGLVLPPLTAESLSQRRASALIAAVPIP